MWGRALQRQCQTAQGRRLLGSWANLDAVKLSEASPAQAYNLGAVTVHFLYVAYFGAFSRSPRTLQSCIANPLVHAVNGKWHLPAKSNSIPDPYNGDKFVQVPDPQVE